MEPTQQAPPPDLREYVTKDELRTYYPTKEDLGTLRTDLANLKAEVKAEIASSQRWIMGVMIAGITLATAIIGVIVRSS